MIDIHSHLIPEVDDGSQSLEESLSLLKQAEQDGITELITHTPFHEEWRIPDKGVRACTTIQVN